MRDIASSIRDYYDNAVEPVTAAEILTSAPAADTRRRSIPNWVFATSAAMAVVVLVGGPLLLFGGTGTDVVEEPMVTTMSPVPTTVPPTTVAESVAPIPDPTTTAPASPALEPSDVIELTGEDTFNAVAAMGPDGRLVVAYFSGNDEAIKVLRCSDRSCTAEPDIVNLGPAGAHIEGSVEPAELDIALRPDGSPLVIAQQADREYATLYACADAACSSVAIAEFGDVDPCVRSDGSTCSRAEWPQIEVTPDGLPRILYYSSATLKLAECGDATCSLDSRTTVTIDDDIWGHGEPSIRIEPDGRILIAHESERGWEGFTEARVAVCEAGSCVGGVATLTFDGGFGTRTTPAGDGEFRVWYMTGWPPGEGDATGAGGIADIMVATCTPQSCDEAVWVEDAEAWLMSWPVDTRLFATPDQTVAVAFSYWSSDRCSSMLELRVSADAVFAEGSAALGGYSAGGFDAVVYEGSLLAVFGGDEGGLHFAEVALDTAGAAAIGEDLPSLCN